MKRIDKYRSGYIDSIKDFLKDNGIILTVSIISSVTISGIIIYKLNSNEIDIVDYKTISPSSINSEKIIDETTKMIQDLNRNSNLIDDEIIDNLDEATSNLEEDPLYILQTDFSKEDFQNYIFGLLDKEKKDKIDKLLEAEIEENRYIIEDVPKNVVEDSVKSTIIFYLSGGDLPAFDYLRTFREKVTYSVAALNSIFKIETGNRYINYSTTARSHTLAFGRGQINGSTLGEISVRLLEKDFPLDKINHIYHGEKYRYPYHKIKGLVNDISHGKNWSFKYRDKTINDLITYSKRFNYRVKTYLKEKYGRNIPDKFKFLFNKYNQLSTNRLYDWSISMLYLYRDPVFQGYMSLHVLQEKMRMASRIYRGKIYSSNKLLEYAFQLYNGSQKRVNSEKLGYVKYCKLYAHKVKNYFKKYVNNIKNSRFLAMNETDNRYVDI